MSVQLQVAALFAHLLATDALPWSVLNCVRLTEEDTTSSSRIFIKYLFQVQDLCLLCIRERGQEELGGACLIGPVVLGCTCHH